MLATNCHGSQPGVVSQLSAKGERDSTSTSHRSQIERDDCPEKAIQVDHLYADSRHSG
jgi:hypothetical protein